MSDSQKILVPDVGGDEVEIIEICFAVGDDLEADEGIVTVETDKASMDIPAPFAGKLSALMVSVGDKIKEGDVIAEMTSSSASAEAPVAAEAPEPVAEEAPAPAPVEVEAPVAPVSATSEIIDITVPDIGEDGEVEIIDPPAVINTPDVPRSAELAAPSWECVKLWSGDPRCDEYNTQGKCRTDVSEMDNKWLKCFFQNPLFGKLWAFANPEFSFSVSHNSVSCGHLQTLNSPLVSATFGFVEGICKP